MKILLKGRMAEEAAKHIVDYAHKGLRKRALLNVRREKHGSGWLVDFDRRLVRLSPPEEALLMMVINKECAAIDVTTEEVA